MTRGPVALLLVASVTSAAALCLNPFGCGPTNYDECAAEATKLPSDTGVNVALRQCHLKFTKPEEERKAREAHVAAIKAAERWGKLSLGTNVADVSKYLGAPLSIGEPEPCAAAIGAATKPPAGTLCRRYSWPDRRVGRVCTKPFDSICEFQLYVLNDGSQVVWTWWPESF